MTNHPPLVPDYLFEVSWEICNKVGGIHTVISTKVPQMKEMLGDNYIVIGPDVWKETREHPEFTEDPHLFSFWRDKALSEGLNIRVGRWNTNGNPITILVDFTVFFSKKNEIFAHLWEKYQLDSISGQWDYIEPALFGYAAAKVIESYYEFHISSRDRIIAQFHEWMTGVGVLYLKEHVPQVGTVFTTHATILGRSIAGHGKALYKYLDLLDADSLSRSYNIVSKFSLEKISANQADCFTTVSEITGRECKQFLKKEPDVITPNGFDDSFVPSGEDFEQKRREARELLLAVASAMQGYPADNDSILLLTSGRYEIRNKGIDLFIDSLGQLNKKGGKPVIGFIMVPANNSGPCKELQESLNNKVIPGHSCNKYCTHYLFDENLDPVLQRIRQAGLNNAREDNVRIIFVPAYLNGSDGIFNKTYYDLLIGFDLTIFPSYYEPWGCTPSESAAFSIPTVTTTLAGFGLWVKSNRPESADSVKVIERIEDNESQVVDEIVSFVLSYSAKNETERNLLRSQAREVSRTVLWNIFAEHYKQAYSIALQKVAERSDLFIGKRQNVSYFLKDISKEQKPVWNKVFIEPAIPARLDKLQKLARNIWWSWNYDAVGLFKSIDPELWKQSGHNPLILIELLNIDQLKKLENNKKFLAKLDEVYDRLEKYLAASSGKPDEKIAYFSMEYGLHDTIKIYSGGLGMLAGDYLKQASDSNKNITAVGLLYRYGYFQQSISFFGDQIAIYTPQKFSQLPLIPVRASDGEWLKVTLALPGRNLYAKAWRVDVGRIPLYLLDADISENLPNDRVVTHQLYGGDLENRFKQELLLGVGGIRLLQQMGIKADVYHCNEGHAAFINLERLRTLVQERGLSFQQALEIVRSSSLFTTHTAVPAGHDMFDEDMLRTYIPHYPDRLNISWEQFMNLGKFKENDPGAKFSMNVLAAKMSQEINGVSKIHGRVTREMFQFLYDGYFPQELNIGYVTNGVHLPTWAGEHWLELYRDNLGEICLSDQSNPEHWSKIRQVDDKAIWNLRNHYRKELIDYIRYRLKEEMTRRQENPKIKLRMIDGLSENALTIGFARRFATYKRAHLLFSNLERLEVILSNKNFPVQIIYAGKAHPADTAGQDLIKKIIEISRKPEFIGKIFFMENYDIEIAKKLIQGVDVWLNTPARPLEASGTSGEKAVMNGVLNLSVLDGWWAEGYRPGAGWGIEEARTYANQQFQDELDAEMIYDLLEEEIVPLFYHRKDEIPHKWISYIKNSIAEIAPHYTMKRMLDDYQNRYYKKMVLRNREMKKDHYRLAGEIEAWKSKITSAWNGIEVTRLAVPDSSQRPLRLGEDFIAEIDLNLNGLSAEDLGIDILFGQKEEDVVKNIAYKEEMKLTDSDDHHAVFKCRIPVERVGVYDYAFRLYPKSKLLPHRQDFGLVKWI